jgi:hypothetical protein
MTFATVALNAAEKVLREKRQQRKKALIVSALRASPVNKAGALRFLEPVFLTEFFDTPFGVDDFLFTCVKGVTHAANLNIQVMPQCRARAELIAAGATDVDFFIFRVNIGFHAYSSLPAVRLRAA